MALTNNSIQTIYASSEYGFEPSEPVVEPLTKKARHDLLQSEREHFNARTCKDIPENWPKHGDGGHITHVYRVICNAPPGKDCIFPPDADQALSQLRNINFTDPNNKLQVLLHVDKASDPRFHNGSMACRPFLSTTLSLPLTFIPGWGNDGLAYDKESEPPPEPDYARIDLFALWEAGLFDPSNFADLSTRANWQDFLQPFSRLGPFENEWLMHQKKWNLNVNEASINSSHLMEWVIGPRGDWWCGYAVLVDSSDAILENQTSNAGFQFGTELKQYYSKYQ